MTDEIVLASDNVGKIKEVNALLQGQRYTVVGQGELGVVPAEETGTTFVENAILKAKNAALQTGRAAIADDSGLEVDALNGQPGVYSARFAGAGATDSRNVDKLLSMLGDIPAQDRTARFRCLLVYMRHAQDATPVICEGTWEGFIHTTSRGENGFGYDPVFWVASEQCCVAELESVRKNQLSHRGQALRQLVDRIAL
ncbi:RdgB/HAM1 family non-canonical purine NTP pyrophosphatase [Gammaproteobacteria bacterium]|nr:RdgB/HAM1 family non-canonical purine NTP pyrophosphatase [Gammaproteobacteria bacterium]